MAEWSRRRTLVAAATAGTASLAGCPGWFTDDDLAERPQYDEAAVSAIPADDIPQIRRQFPAGVDASYPGASYERAAGRFEHVPRVVGMDDAPNHVIRSILNSFRNRATERFRSADRETMRGLDRARERAWELADVYDAVVGDLDADGVRARRDAIDAELAALLDELTYDGDDVVETLAAMAAIERRVGAAERRLDDPDLGVDQFELVRDAAEDTSLTHDDWEMEKARDHLRAIADVGSDHALAAGSVADADHYLERFQATVEDGQDFEGRFERTGALLLEIVGARGAALGSWRELTEDPAAALDVPIADTPAAEVVSRLAYQMPIESRIERSLEQRPAQMVVAAHRFAHYLDAIERALAWFDDGRLRMPADAADLAARRRSAVEAIEDAVPSATYVRLTESGLRAAPHHVRAGDDAVSTTVHHGRVRSAAAEYATAEVLVDVVPETNEWVVDAIS